MSVFESIRDFLENIIHLYGANDPDWLTRNASEILDELTPFDRHEVKGRFFEISHRQLTSSDFLWSCYKQFANGIAPQKETNLILMWRSDFDRLLTNQRSAPSEIITYICGTKPCKDGRPHDDLAFVVIRDSETGKAVGGSTACSRCGRTAFNQDLLIAP